MYFGTIACLIRHEFICNRDSYDQHSILMQFVYDLERKRWDCAAETAIDFSWYCGTARWNQEVQKCLGRVKELLLTFGETIPEEYAPLLGVVEPMTHLEQRPVKRILYWLDQILKMVEDYNSFLEIRVVPYPP